MAIIDNSFYMKLALKEAWKYQGLTYPNPAVGCSVVGKYGELLSVDAHKKAGMPHAEVNAIRNAKKTDLTGSELYLTGHTYCCDNCLSEMKAAGIRKVFILNEDEVVRDYSLF